MTLTHEEEKFAKRVLSNLGPSGEDLVARTLAFTRDIGNLQSRVAELQIQNSGLRQQVEEAEKLERGRIQKIVLSHLGCDCACKLAEKAGSSCADMISGQICDTQND